MSFGTKHVESMKTNQPDLYRDLKRSGELGAHLSEVEERAERQFQTLANELEAQLDREHPERRGFLNRAQALMEAESQVMREIVLVPSADAD